VYVVGGPDVAYDVLVDDFLDWFEQDFTGNGGWEVEEYDSWHEFLVGNETEEYDPSSLEGRGHGPGVASRLVPHEMVVRERDDVVDFLVDLALDVEDWGAYWLGGVVNDVDPDDMAVHPSMRSSIWSITTSTDEGARRIRSFFPEDAGCSYNHHSPSEPDWRRTLWSDKHYKTLEWIKDIYDPHRRFNCWHCVGYQGPEYEQR